MQSLRMPMSCMIIYNTRAERHPTLHLLPTTTALSSPGSYKDLELQMSNPEADEAWGGSRMYRNCTLEGKGWVGRDSAVISLLMSCWGGFDHYSY